MFKDKLKLTNTVINKINQAERDLQELKKEHEKELNKAIAEVTSSEQATQKAAEIDESYKNKAEDLGFNYTQAIRKIYDDKINELEYLLKDLKRERKSMTREFMRADYPTLENDYNLDEYFKTTFNIVQ